MKRVLISGGSGFIGSTFIRKFVNEHPDDILINVDCLTYAAQKETFEHKNYVFIKEDITNLNIDNIFNEYKPTHVIHMAAESHVDNSLDFNTINTFVHTNVEGTLNLLKSSVKHNVQRFLYVSTDEVYGSMADGQSADENTLLNPRNPYSASKASGEHFVNAFHNSFGLDTVITRCTNNMGKYQHEEKMIPRSIKKLLNDEPITLYGSGTQSREWIHTSDHCEGIMTVLQRGFSGEIYNITGGTSKTNIEIAHLLCKYLDKNPKKYIINVEDRPGHDARYSIKSDKIGTLGYYPGVSFEHGLESTVNWYVKQHNKEKS
jgi:dTDP-glucose 4,6-dehydratase